MSSQEILSLIEQFETAFDTFWQVFQKNNEEVLSQLRSAWRSMQAEQKEGEIIIDSDSRIKKLVSQTVFFRVASFGLTFFPLSVPKVMFTSAAIALPEVKMEASTFR